MEESWKWGDEKVAWKRRNWIISNSQTHISLPNSAFVATIRRFKCRDKNLANMVHSLVLAIGSMSFLDPFPASWIQFRKNENCQAFL
jgi:hypothetical protein